jgi:hypothetical protein
VGILKSELKLYKLNLATFLPAEEGPLDHDYEEVMDKVYSTRLDLMGAPLSRPELELFTDGSNFVQGGQQKAVLSHHC